MSVVNEKELNPDSLAQFLVPPGSKALPTIANQLRIDTGMFFPSGNTVGLAAKGSLVLQAKKSQIDNKVPVLRRYSNASKMLSLYNDSNETRSIDVLPDGSLEIQASSAVLRLDAGSLRVGPQDPLDITHNSKFVVGDGVSAFDEILSIQPDRIVSTVPVQYPVVFGAALPTASQGSMVFVNDDLTYGMTLCYYDGSNWRRVVDGNLVEILLP